MDVNSDLRRSPRLQQNGYYNEDGRPFINYYEAPYRKPSRKGRWSATAVSGFLTRHPFILVLCAIAVVSYASIKGHANFIYSPVLDEPPKMTRDESIQWSVLDEPPKMTRDESIQWSVLDEPPKMTRDESIQWSVLDEPPKMTRDESIQWSVLDEPPKMTRDESIQWSVLDETPKMMRGKSIQSPKPDGLPNVPPPSQVSKILRDRSSETYARKGYMERVFNWFCPKYHWALQDCKNLVPGFCWPFAGSAGKFHVQLDKPVHISHVTIGHITKDQSPTGEITTAPKLFSLYGMETSGDETLLGRFEYDASGPAFQTFPVDSAVQGTFKDVRLNVESNWGNTEYTCLYNFKVHGTPVQPEGRV
uniref:SUN domain-containing protein n=1 Tax=Neogobius melanostomus TaxID=47308 RepID=A0A8C6T5Q7_9GOBI